MTLVADWRAVLRHAWSIRFILLAAVFSGLEVAVPLLQGLLPISPGLFAVLCFACVVGAFIARLVAQKQLSPASEPDFDSGDL